MPFTSDVNSPKNENLQSVQQLIHIKRYSHMRQSQTSSNQGSFSKSTKMKFSNIHADIINDSLCKQRSHNDYSYHTDSLSADLQQSVRYHFQAQIGKISYDSMWRTHIIKMNLMPTDFGPMLLTLWIPNEESWHINAAASSTAVDKVKQLNKYSRNWRGSHHNSQYSTSTGWLAVYSTDPCLSVTCIQRPVKNETHRHCRIQMLNLNESR